MNHIEGINAAVTFIKENSGAYNPTVGLILGSGLGPVAESIIDPVVFPYGDIPAFPKSTVKGHAGELVIGKLEGKEVLVMKGRFHFYEGHSMHTIALPIRVMKELGIQQLFITTATGGVNTEKLKTGDLMLITDHINLVYNNPLIGPNFEKYGPRFPDTSNAYTPRLQRVARQAAADLDIKLKEGTYLFTTGPSYETPAEVRMMQFLGTDVAGMSCVPEVLVANHCGMDVVGITYIANMGAGLSNATLTHDDVMETMKLVKDDLIALVKRIVTNIDSD